MKPSGWIGLLIIVAALAMGARAFVTNLTPYVSFPEARSQKRAVQVMGKLEKKSVSYEGGKLAFTLIAKDNSGSTMPVVFTAQRPPNFEDAVEVTAIGSYDRDADIFRAKNLLVKCPTKYSGTEQNGGAAAAGEPETKIYGSASGT